MKQNHRTIKVIALMGALLSSQGLLAERTVEDDNWYGTIGLGLSQVDPEGVAAGWYTPSWGDDSNGYKVVIGKHLSDHWGLELGFSDMGEADLTNLFPSQNALIPDATISYKAPSLMLNYYLWDYSSEFNIYGKFGAVHIRNSASDSRIPFEKQSNTQTAFGLGLQYRFKDDWFLRLEGEAYDRDALFLTLQIGTYF